RPSESQLSIGLPLHLIALLVDRAVVAATEHREIRQRRRTTVGPVPDVMTLTERQSAAGEAATSLSMLERPAQCRPNSPRPRTDVRNSASWVVSHDDAARIARQALSRFCRNARAGFEDRLTWRVRVGEHLGINVVDLLVALPWRTRNTSGGGCYRADVR